MLLGLPSESSAMHLAVLRPFLLSAMSCWKPLSSTEMDPIPEDIIKTCISELVGKIVFAFKKNWDVTGRRHM